MLTHRPPQGSRDGQGKPPRRTHVRTNRNTTLYVVPGKKFRKLYLMDNEARFDLEDNWLANMVRICLFVACLCRLFDPCCFLSRVTACSLFSPLNVAKQDAEVLAWCLHHFPPSLDKNGLVSALENDVDREQMKSVLLKVSE